MELIPGKIYKLNKEIGCHLSGTKVMFQFCSLTWVVVRPVDELLRPLRSKTRQNMENASTYFKLTGTVEVKTEDLEEIKNA